MGFGSMKTGEENAPIAEINMVPLIDVMLVLLVIFLVTAPMLTHAVKVDLPQASSTPNPPKPEQIQIAIDATQSVYWNQQRISPAELAERMQSAAALQPQPEVQIRAERTALYEQVAQIMSEASRAGLTRIGFVTEPTQP